MVFVVCGDDVHLGGPWTVEHEVEDHRPVRVNEALDDEAIHVELLRDLGTIFAEMLRGVFLVRDQRADDQSGGGRSCCDRRTVAGAVRRVAGSRLDSVSFIPDGWLASRWNCSRIGIAGGWRSCLRRLVQALPERRQAQCCESRWNEKDSEPRDFDMKDRMHRHPPEPWSCQSRRTGLRPILHAAPAYESRYSDLTLPA